MVLVSGHAPEGPALCRGTVPALGSGKVTCVTPPGQEDGGTPPTPRHSAGDQLLPSPECAGPAPGRLPPPRPHSRAAEPPLGRRRTCCVAFFQKWKQSPASVAALWSTRLSGMSFVVLSGRPAGWGVFLHTGSEWAVVSLPLLEGTCFLEHKSLLQDRGTQKAPLGLARVTEAKCSKPGPALERVRPAGGAGGGWTS